MLSSKSIFCGVTKTTVEIFWSPYYTSGLGSERVWIQRDFSCSMDEDGSDCPHRSDPDCEVIRRNAM